MEKGKSSLKNLSIKNLSIQSSIFMYFTVTAIIAIALISLIIFQRFTNSLNATIIEENSGIVGQLGESVDSYLRNAMKVSDSIYYNVVGVDYGSSNMSINGSSEESVIIPITLMQQAYN